MKRCGHGCRKTTPQGRRLGRGMVGLITAPGYAEEMEGGGDGDLKEITTWFYLLSFQRGPAVHHLGYRNW